MKVNAGFLATLVSCLLICQTTHASSCASKVINGCQFKVNGSLNLNNATQHHAKIIPLRINDDTFGDISLFHSKAHATDSVRGSFSFSNDTHSQVKFKYAVILKDKKGVVAQTHGHLHLPPGHTQKIKISNIVLRESDIKNINSYEIKMQGL